MPTYSVISLSDTIVKLTQDSTEILFKKVYCTTQVSGDYVYFFAHELETGKLRQEYSILYTDCTIPSESSAIDLKIAIDAIIDAYAGSGGGGGSLDGGTATSIPIPSLIINGGNA